MASTGRPVDVIWDAQGVRVRAQDGESWWIGREKAGSEAPGFAEFIRVLGVSASFLRLVGLGTAAVAGGSHAGFGGSILLDLDILFPDSIGDVLLFGGRFFADADLLGDTSLLAD